MTRLLHRTSGFSLIELAVVLFIVSLLIGGLLMPLSAQHEIRGRQETDKALANIGEALLGFAVINGRLPCPAPAALATGATGVGLEATTAAAGTTSTTGPCGCTTANSGLASAGGAICDDSTPGDVTGVLPWATLGLPETDAWGNRYTYRMTTRFGRLASGQTAFGACAPTSNPTSAAFALCSAGNISVLPAVGSTTPLASSVPAIVISHGKNTLGAYSPNGTQIGGLTAGSDEAENANGDATFVSSTAIDDQLIWLSTSILMGRMLAAGKLP
ncbi:MAG: prepilin-type N-terminal cleavage/methylation domain-containing protein [Rhodocyclales bacterium]|nr:prepilin-type N-terminal cleavage/methylation domain-containing protein [Rhodocyclales bacterium]